MRKLLITALSIATMLLAAGNSQAALIGVQLAVPDILSNTSGVYSYNAATNLFSTTATPLTITWDNVNLINITGARSYSARFLVDESGNFAGNVAGDDLVITGAIDFNGNGVVDGAEPSGILLTGEITNFGWENLVMTLDAFDYTFDVTGGYLASQYNAKGGGDFLTSETSNFKGNFNVNFNGGKAKHDTAPLVPEPGSMALLGMGILGLLGLKRRKA